MPNGNAVSFTIAVAVAITAGFVCPIGHELLAQYAAVLQAGSIGADKEWAIGPLCSSLALDEGRQDGLVA